MQLTTSRVDEESRVGMMITGACQLPTSGKGTEASGQGQRTASLGQAVPVLRRHGSHNTGVPGLEVAWCRARPCLEAKIK